MRSDTKNGAWAHARAVKARETVRRAIVEALVAVHGYESDACPETPRLSWDCAANTLAAEILRRLGLAPIGREVVAGKVHDLARKAGYPSLPEPRR